MGRLFRLWLDKTGGRKATMERAAAAAIEGEPATTMERGEAKITEKGTFKEIKSEIRKDWNDSWLETMFKFGIEAVNSEEISPEGMRYLKCKSLYTSSAFSCYLPLLPSLSIGCRSLPHMLTNLRCLLVARYTLAYDRAARG